MAADDAATPWPLRVLSTILALFGIARNPSEADVLLAFRATLTGPGGVSPPPRLSSWDPSSSPPCNGRSSTWYGVTCDINGTVHSLQLAGIGLTGPAPELGVLAGLHALRSLNLANNQLNGPFPDVSALTTLRGLFLSGNSFSGPIPSDAFGGLLRLRKVFLSRNNLSGPVPVTMTMLPRLTEVRLDRNHFDGPMPDLQQTGLRVFDVAMNNLSGPIPAGLHRFGTANFEGNKFLCGPPLAAACTPELVTPPPPILPPPPVLPPPPPSKTSTIMTVGIILIALGVLLALLGLVMLILARRRRRRSQPVIQMPNYPTKDAVIPEADKLENGTTTGGTVVVAPTAALPAAAAAGGKKEKKRVAKDHEHGHLGRLVFVGEGATSRARFQVEDLLRASAEVLGSGSFGASYKAVLFDGSPGVGAAMVVKKFTEMNGVGREEFQEHMSRMGRLKHPNLLPLVAYVYKKDEKLLITDYIPNGSLAHRLHGNHGPNNQPLDWPTRLRLIKGVAKAMSYLAEALPMLAVPHGHLKSSNVLLGTSSDALVTDYALAPVMCPSHAAKNMVAYKAPECAHSGKPSNKSDVWSLGILILEVLTGRFPEKYLHQGRAGPDLPVWVHSVLADGGDVFDPEMEADRSPSGEMHQLLKVGIACCEADVARRCDLPTAAAKIEEIGE